MCGVIGVYDNEEVVGKLYNAMLTIQHRGQDSAGMLTYDGRYHIKKGNGLIRDIFDERNILRLRGHIGLGHTRYPTVGEGSVEDAQPFWINYPFGMAAAHNGNVTNFSDLKRELFEKNHILTNSNCDVEAILNIFATYLQGYRTRPITPELIFHAVRYVYRRVKGSYSVVIHIANLGMVAFRDPYGLRPLLFGTQVDGMVPAYAFASESVSLAAMGFSQMRDVEPGSAIFIDRERRVHESRISRKPFRPCIFEYIYFARPDSYLNGINVYTSRVELGRSLGKKIRRMQLKVDVVVPVPDSARAAAIEIANILKVKYREGLVKNRYIGRTFIMPGDPVRQLSIRHKLNPITEVFRGKDVLLVDDSIVRGNTSRSIIQMVRNAGARSVHFASYSAPLTHPCVYGIDMQTSNEFVAANSTSEQIAAKINADSVIYQDLDAMERAVRKQNTRIRHFCKACFTGHYPTGDISRRMLDTIEAERDAQHALVREG
ncbi:MAG: amidophosphoribosyltransferase [Candidatus Aminicenantes bacterium]|nr:amidophosphoribosyltransferase [Candidatus Aminicenantes bacterium]